MTWKTLTEADVLAALNATELETYRGSLATGQADPVTPILDAITAEVRAFVARVKTLTEDGIPVALENCAVDIAVYRLAKRLQLTTELQRKEASDAAYGRLQAAADGEIDLDTDTVEEDPEGDPADSNWGSETKIDLRA